MGRRRRQYKRMAAVGSREVLGVGYEASDFHDQLGPKSRLRLAKKAPVERPLRRAPPKPGPASNGTRDSAIFSLLVAINPEKR
jgi:hypothetical protein